ncbi:dTDP-4-dehydrorhamnose reductase [Phenylobacterium sp.]|uniref:dTDP-4-dehydrorhamnose reductase n=1 Tax=Phenylobacterium sp. TaxID=1871053 RepID=UPI00356532A8
MSIRVLQFGTTGQLALELLAEAKDFDVEITALSRAEADFNDPQGAASRVRAGETDLVVIAAAHTAVDDAEAEPDVAQCVNATTPGAIARSAQAAGVPVVFVSTDYVFDGAKGAAYVETDPVGPINVYGRSKVDGEAAVLGGCARALVLRTSWVVSSHGKNFVKTMLRLAKGPGPIKVVDDQFGRPTAARDLARFILGQAATLATAPAGAPVFGLFHFANAGEVTWKGFAEGVFDLALGADAPKVQAITTAEFTRPAARPARGTLDTGKLERTFGVRPRPWREALAEIVGELKLEQRSAA